MAEELNPLDQYNQDVKEEDNNIRMQYQSPSDAELEESGDLKPIDATEQANQQVNKAVTAPIRGALDLTSTAIQGGKVKSMHEWRGMEPGEEREAEKEKWFQHYYGSSSEEYRQKNFLQQWGDSFKNQGVGASSLAASVGMGVFDFPMDLIGLLPGGDKLDEGWDDATAFKNPVLQSVRKLSSIVIPTLMGSKGIGNKLGPMMAADDVPWLAKSLTNIGAYGALDVGVIGVSDVGEDDNAARALVDFFPDTFGPDGSIPLPKFLVTLDGDSPSVRKYKNMFEAGGLSIATNILGYWVSAGKPTMKWYNPLDDTARQYKNAEISLNADNQTLVEIQEIDELLLKTQGKINKVDKSTLLAKRQLLVDKAQSVGTIEDYVKNAESSQIDQNNTRASAKLEADPGKLDLDPDINPAFVDEAAKANQSIPPGNVARNMADTTVIKDGSVTGTPAPVISDAMRTKGLSVGNTSRDAVMGVAEQARDAGNFNAVVDGFRVSNKQMNAGAWKIYRSIVAADNLDDVKNLFLDNKSVINLGKGLFRQEYANEEQFGAALFALRDLTDRYLGRGIMQSSARVMDTLGREVSDMAQATRELAPNVNDDRVMDLILDKMEYLMTELGINKYVRGWQLKRADTWYNMLGAADDPDDAINILKLEFLEAEGAIAEKSQAFTQELKRLQIENPLALKPLVTQFERSGGDVDTLAKLMKWASDEVTPLGMLKSPNPNKMNKWAQGAWAVGYNNILSGLAAGRAVLGNTAGLIAKPITAFTGGTLDGLITGGDFSALKRSMYYYGGVFETNRRVMKDSWKMMKKVWKDPDAMLDTMRKDMIQAESIDWDSLDDTRRIWQQEGKWGEIIQLDSARAMYDLSRWAPMRAGMTLLQSADAGLNAATATYVSRLRAYDDVFTKTGRVDMDAIAIAEKKNYASYFDAEGRLTDDASKVVSGELALNQQDWLSDQINKVVTRYPFMKTIFMFPRTLSNNMKLNLSWTPIATIPGLTKYGDTIWAKTPDDIAKAMQRHGLDINKTPNAEAIFKNLQVEYRGRLAFTGMLSLGMYQYAMGGNIRGNGSHVPSTRKMDRDQLGFTEKTIKDPITGNWISFKGIPMVDPVLTMLGDLAYHARDIESSIAEDVIDKLSWTLSATFLNESVMTGLEPFVAVMNGDMTWFSRYAANTARVFLPMSGAAGVLSKAIDSTQKDIHDNFMHYILNRTPVMSMGLPKQVDIYTGQYLNDINNPILRIINALSPVQVSGTNEPWRQDLRDSGYDGLSMLKKDSTGSYTYTGSEREYVNGLVGKQEIYKDIIKILKKPKYQDQIGALRAHRATGDDTEYARITIGEERLPVFREIDKVIRRAQKKAELIMLKERPDIWDTISHQKLVNKYVQQGRVDDARGVAEKNNDMVNLLKTRK